MATYDAGGTLSARRARATCSPGDFFPGAALCPSGASQAASPHTRAPLNLFRMALPAPCRAALTVVLPGAQAAHPIGPLWHGRFPLVQHGAPSSRSFSDVRPDT
ncbi:hypothetical protein GCM10011400_03590 [Paraburkholderia caffeinilytica]|uniref:Uncharacterized protein n=1 Tax=Paraburkholderia caffeinilytica TaxID=1761016 RepID=A0ABQ1L736_9BURK|nr:hypothetical protein GCM10011400_03590 [Paraburkholderia caffeinilytica]